MSTSNKESEIPEILHSNKNIYSYGLGEFIMQTFSIAFGAYVFYFYEVEIGLNSWLVAIGFILYAIWNAVNDPLVGYICDRPFSFTKKWGRRFPWIISFIVPSILTYVTFSLISRDPASLVKMLCLLTMSSLRRVSIFPTFSVLTSRTI